MASPQLSLLHIIDHTSPHLSALQILSSNSQPDSVLDSVKESILGCVGSQLSPALVWHFLFHSYYWHEGFIRTLEGFDRVKHDLKLFNITTVEKWSQMKLKEISIRSKVSRPKASRISWKQGALWMIFYLKIQLAKYLKRNRFIFWLVFQADCLMKA